MNPDQTNWPTQRWLAIGYAVAIAALIINSILTFWNLNTIRTTWDTLVSDRDFVRGIDRLLSDMKDAETGQRGYLVTGDERYLEPYTRSQAVMIASIEHLRLLAGDSRQPPRTPGGRRGGVSSQTCRAGTGHFSSQAERTRSRHCECQDRPRQGGHGSCRRRVDGASDRRGRGPGSLKESVTDCDHQDDAHLRVRIWPGPGVALRRPPSERTQPRSAPPACRVACYDPPKHRGRGDCDRRPGAA